MYLGAKLKVVKSELAEALKSRAYTEEQVKLIINSQTEKNSLSTKIAFVAGLRAHELLTLLPKDDRPASTHRTWSNQRFMEKNGIIYTVIGKGGLIREVLIPKELAAELERYRLKEPMTIKDREINYISYYNIAGGKIGQIVFQQQANDYSIGRMVRMVYVIVSRKTEWMNCNNKG